MSKTEGKIMTENVARVFSFAEASSFKKHEKELKKWIVLKKKEWKQETIAYEFEGDLFYI